MRRRGTVALACTAAILLLAAAAHAQPPPAGRLQAFVLTGAPDSLTDLEAHAHDIGVVYPTNWTCERPGSRSSGRIAAEGDTAENAQTARRAAAIAAYAHARGIAVMPRLSCQSGAIVHRILTEPALRERTLAQLVTLVRAPDYAGLNLDFENDGPGDRGALSSFVRTLARRLHAERRELAVDVVVDVSSEPDPRSQAGFYDYRSLSASADTVFVMAWGTHWERSGPGPIAPPSYVREVARYVASLPHARRFVLGVPMYGLDWPVLSSAVSGSGVVRPARASALQYAGVVALARSVGATPARDPRSGELTFTYNTRAGVPHRVWYMDAQAIADCLRIARRYGLSAGVWRLGEEDQALWGEPEV